MRPGTDALMATATKHVKAPFGTRPVRDSDGTPDRGARLDGVSTEKPSHTREDLNIYHPKHLAPTKRR